MQITEILAQMGGLQSMARELDIDETQAASGAEALVPAILGGFKKQDSAACSDSLAVAACSIRCWRRSLRM